MVSDITAQLWHAREDANFQVAVCPLHRFTASTHRPHRAQFDVMRNIKFAAFCWLYVGSFQHFVYNVAFKRLFPGSGVACTAECPCPEAACATGMVVAFKKAIADNFVHSPFLYLPGTHPAEHGLLGLPL